MKNHMFYVIIQISKLHCLDVSLEQTFIFVDGTKRNKWFDVSFLGLEMFKAVVNELYVMQETYILLFNPKGF